MTPRSLRTEHAPSFQRAPWNHRLFAAFTVVAIPLSLGCSPPKATMTSVRLQGSGPKNALVVVDEQVIGYLAEVQARGFAVLPGKHFITVKAPGYLPFDHVLQTTDRPKEVISVQLEKWPDD